MQFQKEIEEACTIDGANEFQLLTKLYIPMSGASIATVTLFYAISRWNGYYWSRMLIKNSNEQPLQVYLRQLIENYQKLYDESPVVLDYAADSLVYAIIVCSIIPVLVIYPYIQKNISLVELILVALRVNIAKSNFNKTILKKWKGKRKMKKRNFFRFSICCSSSSWSLLLWTKK
ncbi:MAG: ABC transporter permease subunit [Clostridium sp.]|nr:MAG: ABC transporter permease subunit [Clostridium sp.]